MSVSRPFKKLTEMGPHAVKNTHIYKTKEVRQVYQIIGKV